MANTLTSLIPTIYEALDVVSREMIGFIPAVAKDVSAERAALNQQILVPVTQAQAAQDITPAVIPPDTGDQTIGNVPMTITKCKMVPIRWNGEQQKGFKSTGTYERVLREQFAQGFRTLANLSKPTCFTAAYQGASRATARPARLRSAPLATCPARPMCARSSTITAARRATCIWCSARLRSPISAACRPSC